MPSLSAVDTRNGISPIPFSKKCARGARLLAISRGRGRAFFCNHISSGVASTGLKDEDGQISDIPDAHFDVDGRPTIVIHVERFAQARELLRERWLRDDLCQLMSNGGRYVRMVPS
jgi:hypothetical protein